MKLSYSMKRISDLLDWIMVRVVFIGIVGMIISITLQIIFRVFFSALVWTEEAARYLLIWSSFLGATLAYKRKMHIAVTFGVEQLPRKLKKVVMLLSIVLSMFFFGVCAYYGLELIKMQIFQLSPALRLPMKYVYLGIPLSFAIMFIHGLAFLFEMLTKHGEVEV
ncbi:tripartite ATP-independent periplasmic transporter, DctQ component [Clostridium aceticum]|uniref:Tripartite ATP-independent periplasmic transporter, DctQ component n=1 Tax=Clostridium aceticum TaxID=84022 RepID=A0A0D8I710_9CLOT|nr:TRAP transporter small permease [Clostridium aceticum]AKL93806.1 tripartite ATP-independent periplasmic transporter, DctQ component [Clostridium aceticum]KJF25834.1 C4-dicarboxylate ABC transporter permease [Clostridium aceticum]